MLKTAFIPIIILILSLNAYGQNARFSFMASPQINWMTSGKAGVKSDGPVAGLNTGIELDLFFAEHYAFSTGLTINNLGGRLIYNDSISINSDGTRIMVPAGNPVKYHLQYISVPLGLKFKTIEIGYTTFWVNAGLTPMVNIRAKGTSEDGSLDKTSLKDETGLFNINYFIEAGIEYSLGGSTAIVGGLGYYPGFMDVTNRSADKINTYSFALVLGILF